MQRFLPILLTLIVALSACKATKRAYQQGDYDRAVMNSVDRLRRSPNNKKSRETLKKAYPALLNYYLEKISQAKLSPDPLRWEEIMAHYGTLNQAHDEIIRSPAARRVIPRPQYFASEFQAARRNAAEAHYALGEREMGRAADGDRIAAQEAYHHFERAEELRPGWRDTREQMDHARESATLFVEIEPIPIHAQALQLSNEFFQNQVIEYAASANLGEFVYFYPAGRSRGRQPDHVLRMSFDDFVVGQAYVKETVRERRRDSVVIDEVQRGDSVRPIYGTVEAQVHQFEKKVTSTGLLDLRVIDARSGRVLSQRKFPGTHHWVDRWGYFNGDKRALSEEDKAFTRRRRESPVPPPQQLFIEFTKPIYGQVTRYLRDFYRE